MNSFQQPVDGEPSAGTLHFHFEQVLSADPADTSWHELAFTSTQVPVGTKAVVLRGEMVAATANRYVDISNSSSGASVYAELYNPAISVYDTKTGMVCPLSTGKSIWYMASNADISVFRLWLLGYYC
jgi:hypothetical protein